MAQFASSNFNGTEGDDLSTFDANWVKNGTITGGIEIASSRARSSTVTTPAYYYNATPASADYSVTVEVFVPSGGANSARTGPVARMAASPNTMYVARYDSANSRVEISKFVAGTSTSLGTSSRSVSVDVSYPLTIDVSGSSINVTWNNEGSPLLSVTDTSITAAGFPGIRWFNANTPTDTAGLQLDNFSADEAGGGAVSLTVADASHAHTAENVVLTSATALTVADASHAQSAENVALSIDVALTVQDSAHAQIAESVALSAVETLTVADASHAQSAENVTLTVGGIGLTVADTAHAQTAESVALSSDSFLITADGSHGQVADLVTLSTATFFAVDDTVHAQTADSLTLDGAPTLIVGSAVHSQFADEVILTLDYWLQAANAFHAQVAQNLTLGGSDREYDVFEGRSVTLADGRATVISSGRTATFVR